MSVEVRDVTVGYYKDIYVLNKLSIKAEKGRITGIIGPNGAGKSTLLKVIFGLLKPVEGKIFYEKEDVTGWPPNKLIKKGMSLVLQSRSLFPSLSVDENLELGAWTLKNEKEKIEDLKEQVYSLFPDLRPKKKEKAGNLSGGLQRMLEIGRSLMTNPKTLLLDEPTAMLSPKISKKIYDAIEELKKQKRTILLVDQNVKECVRVSDYIYVLELGRNKVEGEKELFLTKMEDIIKDWLVA